MSELWESFCKLSALFAPTCEEQEIIGYIRKRIAPHTDEIVGDGLGGITGHMKGAGKRVLLSVSVDSPGFMVTHIDSGGFARVAVPPGISSHAVSGAEVRLSSGIRGILQHSGKDGLFIDFGRHGPETELCRVGDSAVFAAEPVRMGDFVAAPNAARLMLLSLLLTLIPALRAKGRALSFSFAVQGEVHCRGAKPAAFGQTPHSALVLDASAAADTPDSKDGPVTGGGAALRYMDRTAICPVALRSALQETAKAAVLPLQADLHSREESGAGGIQLTGSGIPTAVLTIPARYCHTHREMCAPSDADSLGRLITAFLTGF